MLAKVHSFGISGLEAYPITIEVDVANGLPSMTIVGLPDNAVKESRERVRSALKNSGFKFPPQRITVNLSPADIKKEGPAFDLAIALGILAASEQISPSLLREYLFLGELSLDGRIQSITGSLCITTSIKKDSFKGLLLPSKNAKEASLCGRLPIFPVETLKEVLYFLENPQSIPPFVLDKTLLLQKDHFDGDFADVKGQIYVKRGLEVAAAGGHNLLMIGPPGSGKTMLAQRIISILPDMTFEESLETTKIHSVLGFVRSHIGIIQNRPFRSPHHTASDVALVGGGPIPKPGEVTLSHNGVLFLDEIPEFRRNVLEALRQPLEENYVTVARASKTLRFPAKFMLIASMNPCPCGWYMDPQKGCNCNSYQIQKYLSKISGPLLDRIDIHLEVPALRSTELLTTTLQETSAQIKKRTTRSRDIQIKRFVNTPI